jgi:hypothetical protein
MGYRWVGKPSKKDGFAVTVQTVINFGKYSTNYRHYTPFIEKSKCFIQSLLLKVLHSNYVLTYIQIFISNYCEQSL